LFWYIIVADENEIHSESYISFKCENIEQAKSLASYLKSKIKNECSFVYQPSEAFES
jgi:hypothetical protein